MKIRTIIKSLCSIDDSIRIETITEDGRKLDFEVTEVAGKNFSIHDTIEVNIINTIRE